MNNSKEEWSLEKAQYDYHHKKRIKRDCINCKFVFIETYCDVIILNYYCNVRNQSITFTGLKAKTCKYFTLKGGGNI